METLQTKAQFEQLIIIRLLYWFRETINDLQGKGRK
jgi:hypothetical protein